MKKGILLVLTAILSISWTVPFLAQGTTDQLPMGEAPEIQDVEGFRTEFKQYAQNPETKEIKFEMILKANIDSDRVRITWTLNGASAFVDKTQAIKTITVQNGKTYNIPITIIPSAYGVTELYGKAEAFKPNESYIATVRKNFGVNKSLEVLPLTDEYNNEKTLSIIKTIVIAAIAVIVGAFGLFIGFKKFVRWLNK